MKNIIFYSLLALSFLAACQSTPKCGPEVRAAFDIGSGSTKMKVVEVNTCANEVTQVLLEEQLKVDYRDDLDKSTEGKTEIQFSEKVQSEGLGALEILKAHAQSKGAKHFTAIATAAFRQAKNAEAFAKRIQTKLAIPVRVISQNEEAMLGFSAVVVKEKLPSASVVVWDIGGGSQQMMGLDENSQPVIYFGQVASVSFKNHVIAKIQKKDVNKVTSPNPMKKAHAQKALAFAESEAAAGVPEALRAKIKAGAKVIGIGGVLGKSVPRQLGPGAELTQKNILTSYEQRTPLKDSQITDPYFATEVTNLGLVAGFMKGLGINSYNIADISILDGLWLSESLWH